MNITAAKAKQDREALMAAAEKLLGMYTDGNVTSIQPYAGPTNKQIHDAWSEMLNAFRAANSNDVEPAWRTAGGIPRFKPKKNLA